MRITIVSDVTLRITIVSRTMTLTKLRFASSMHVYIHQINILTANHKGTTQDSVHLHGHLRKREPEATQESVPFNRSLRDTTQELVPFHRSLRDRFGFVTFDLHFRLSSQLGKQTLSKGTSTLSPNSSSPCSLRQSTNNTLL